MRSCVLTAPGVLSLRTQPVPRIGKAEVLVRVLATGICGSDLATYQGTHPYKKAPTVLGHELCGTVVDIGRDVRAVAIGDLVCAAAYSPCERCPHCKRAAPHLCARKRSLSHEGFEGSFAEYVALAENMTFKLPSELDPALGALVEPLSIATHALRLADADAGASLVIIGTGSIGLCTLLSARALGFGRVVCLDIDPDKGHLALAQGATEYADSRGEEALAGVCARLGDGADVVAVCSGHPGVLNEAAQLVRPGGSIVVVSYFPEPGTVDMNMMVSRELRVIGSALATPADVAEVIRWLDLDGFDPGGIVGRRYPLDDAPLAMEAVERGAAGKTLIEVAGALA